MAKSTNVFIRKKRFKHTRLIIILASMLILSIIASVYFIPEAATYADTAWQWVVAAIMGFVLVNGKFVLKVFLKKIFILSVVGLGKRFFIEKILVENMMRLFVSKLPLSDFISHAKYKIRTTRLVTKLVWLFGLLTSSLGGIIAFGDVMLMKVLIAQFWKAMLALFSKFMLLVGWLLLDSGWFRFLLEVFVLGWLLELIKKVPVMHSFFIWLYSIFESSIKRSSKFLERVFNLPAQRIINSLTIRTSTWMHRTIGSKGYETFHEFILRARNEQPNIHTQLQEYRTSIRPSPYKSLKRRTYSRPQHASPYKLLLESRKTSFDVSEGRMYLHQEHKV